MENQELGPNPAAFASLRRIFLADFYLAAYPDVANSGVDPWGHFSKHGIYEGRAPSPYVDPDYLANNLALPISSVLLEVFSNKKYWAANTSPYVDIRNFVFNGPWDGVRQPLEQLVIDGLTVEPWVKYGNSYSDLASIEEKNQRLLAISILHHVNDKKFKFSTPREYPLAEEGVTKIVFDGEEKVFCIPGYALCAKGTAYSLFENHDLHSPDKSAIKHGGKLTLFESGESMISDTLAIAPNSLRINEARRWLSQLTPNSAIVPASADQEFLLRYCLSIAEKDATRVLVFGIQSEVLCKQLINTAPVTLKPRRLFRSPEKLRRRTLLIVAESNASLMENFRKVSLLVKRGAKICISNNETVPLWQKKIKRASVIVVCGKVTWLDLWVRRSVPIIGLNEWG